MIDPIIFTGNPLDRASELRSDPDWVAGQLAHPEARIVPFWRTKPLIRLEGARAFPAWTSVPALGDHHDPARTLFLGLNGTQTPFFACDVSAVDEPKDDPLLTGLGKFIDLRSICPNLSVPDTGILAQGKAILQWHHSHRFCSYCGVETTMVDGGYRRHCGACSHDHFPRTDPVVIMLVTDGDQCLLGRSADWTPGNYSALAGFVEPGETFEAAVAREVREETAIEVGNVRYFTSQPWPWPMNLMTAFFADALTTGITLRDNELEDAMWASRDQVRLALAGDKAAGFNAAPPLAIAHHLLKAWVA